MGITGGVRCGRAHVYNAVCARELDGVPVLAPSPRSEVGRGHETRQLWRVCRNHLEKVKKVKKCGRGGDSTSGEVGRGGLGAAGGEIGMAVSCAVPVD